jgi:thiol-disulfide isomerase/thioredoxin
LKEIGMRRLSAVAFLGLLGLATIFVCNPLRGQQPPTAPVDVKIIKYADLTDFVRANKGKVILLDFWATTCVPCRASFFHTVEMYQKYRDKGLVVASVSTDPLEPADEAKLKARILKFLDSETATFTNFLLNEPPDVLRTKLHMDFIPCIYVFNQSGQWTQFIGETIEPDTNHRHPNVEQYVAALLEQTKK